MAAYGSTSSDESNGAPTDFHISSSLESSNGRSSVSLERCPVCSHLNRTFFCHDCVRNGDFTSSRDKCPERFAEKKLRLIQLDRLKAALEERIKEKTEKQCKRSSRRQAIKDGRERISLLRHALVEAQEQKAKAVSAVEELQREKQAVRSSVEALSGQLRVARKHVDRLRSDSQRKRQELAVCRRGAKEVVRASLNDLTRYIFPIKEHSPPPSTSGGVQEDDVWTELEEAQRTTYVRGRWVTLVAPPHDTTYSVVEPRLPAHGDYSQYSAWVAEHQESAVSPSMEDPRNVGYTLAAGLLFTAQLVSVLAFYLDVRLPHNLCYSEFGGGELGEEVFRHRVAQLNGNVVHLCASQGVDPSQLRPKATLRNLLLLLNPDMADLGRAEAFEMSPELSLSLEEGLSQDLALSTDSDSDDDCVGDEWESIASLPPPPSDLPSRGVHSTAMSHQQGPQQSPPAASLFSSAVALATNFWRPK
ncbi:beclin 1-associated autophagy-related key regulator isoform X2 [Ixodes scapularis]|uniref:beclin 1-associated autophagy-related key regulator isoform X2 n=1 Tax=Ixodes scapularis TaxID=6945 RepID=UPI001A9F9483|nr:beclin 1-associated autophagy-related key regulator isoform X2 [Ixodes scapularis]